MIRPKLFNEGGPSGAADAVENPPLVEALLSGQAESCEHRKGIRSKFGSGGPSGR